MVAICRFYVALLLLPIAAQPAWPDPFPFVRPETPHRNENGRSRPRSTPPQNSSGTAHDERDGPLMAPVLNSEELPPREGVSLRGARSGSNGMAETAAENGQQGRPCECGVVCQWGFRTVGGRQICNGPWMCSSCMPMPMAYGSSGGSGAR